MIDPDHSLQDTSEASGEINLFQRIEKFQEQQQHMKVHNKIIQMENAVTTFRYPPRPNNGHADDEMMYRCQKLQYKSD
jgi:hypothetical protein